MASMHFALRRRLPEATFVAAVLVARVTLMAPSPINGDATSAICPRRSPAPQGWQEKAACNKMCRLPPCEHVARPWAVNMASMAARKEEEAAKLKAKQPEPEPAEEEWVGF